MRNIKNLLEFRLFAEYVLTYYVLHGIMYSIV